MPRPLTRATRSTSACARSRAWRLTIFTSIYDFYVYLRFFTSIYGFLRIFCKCLGPGQAATRPALMPRPGRASSHTSHTHRTQGEFEACVYPRRTLAHTPHARTLSARTHEARAARPALALNLAPRLTRRETQSRRGSHAPREHARSLTPHARTHAARSHTLCTHARRARRATGTRSQMQICRAETVAPRLTHTHAAREHARSHTRRTHSARTHDHATRSQMRRAETGAPRLSRRDCRAETVAPRLSRRDCRAERTRARAAHTPHACCTHGARVLHTLRSHALRNMQ